MIFLIIINSIVFSLLAILHIYWAMGGKQYLADAIPTQLNGEVAMNPSIIITLLVAAVLLFFAGTTFANAGFLDVVIDPKYIHLATLFIGIIFILRAIGDFKFVGITKRIKETRFAVKDNQVYIPLCLTLGIFNCIIALYRHR